MGHFTFWIRLSLRLSLSPKFGLRPKISQKMESFFDERFAERKLRTEQPLNPKLINSPADFAFTIIAYMEVITLIPMYKSLVGPHSEYCCSVWNPHYGSFFTLIQIKSE